MPLEQLSRHPIIRVYDMIVRGLNGGQHLILLFIRLYFGWQCYVAGHGHLTHVQDTTEFFQSIHIPFPRLNVYISGGTECVGGLLLMAGVASRLIAVPLTFNFLVAILAANEKARHVLEDSGPFVSDTAFPFLFAAVIILFFGPGVFSIDYLIRRFILKSDLRPGLPVSPPPAQN